MPYEVISSFDRTHRTASGIWEVPVGRGRKFGSSLPKALNFVVGDWQVGGVLTMQSGQSLGIGNAILLGSLTDVPLDEPDVDHWFNTDVFERRGICNWGATIARYRRASAGSGATASSRSTCRSQYFPITERVRAQFRANSYKFTNTTGFANPNTAPTNTAFGRVTGANNDARNWQLALRLMF